MCRLLLCRLKPSYSKLTIVQINMFFLCGWDKNTQKAKIKSKNGPWVVIFYSIFSNVLSKSTTLQWCFDSYSAHLVEPEKQNSNGTGRMRQAIFSQEDKSIQKQPESSAQVSECLLQSFCGSPLAPFWFIHLKNMFPGSHFKTKMVLLFLWIS